MCNLQGLEQTLWGVQWTIPHENQHNPFYNSSLSKIWIPESISEFLKQFWEEFDEEWERYCDSTETHLVEHVRGDLPNSDLFLFFSDLCVAFQIATTIC